MKPAAGQQDDQAILIEEYRELAEQISDPSEVTKQIAHHALNNANLTEDSRKTVNREDEIEIKDISELIAEVI